MLSSGADEGKVHSWSVTVGGKGATAAVVVVTLHRGSPSGAEWELNASHLPLVSSGTSICAWY